MENVFREATIKLIGFIVDNPAVSAVSIPVLTLYAVLRFLRWSTNLSRGETLGELQDDVTTYQSRITRQPRPVRRPRR